jgi:hypothetical protein
MTSGHLSNVPDCLCSPPRHGAPDSTQVACAASNLASDAAYSRQARRPVAALTGQHFAKTDDAVRHHTGVDAGWAATIRDVDGNAIAHCQLHGRSTACGKPRRSTTRSGATPGIRPPATSHSSGQAHKPPQIPCRWATRLRGIGDVAASSAAV